MNQLQQRRWAPLTGSLIVAAVFIGIRVFYRLVFGQFSLPALWSALAGALPFAGIIVLCGFLSAVLDVRRFVLTSTRLRFGRSLALALALGISTVPSLARSVTRLRAAARFRGVRHRSALIVPLLEHALERAVSLAATLELAGTPSSIASADCTVTFTNVSLSYGGLPVLKDVTVSFEPGTITVLTGPTGCGKTTVLDAISGLAQHFNSATATGQILVDGLDRATATPHQTGGLIGVVSQHVRDRFTGSSVQDELEWTLRLRGSSPVDARSAARAVAERVGISPLLEQSVQTLSAGQATRVGIAAALAHNPAVLLLDEPLADLDAESVDDILELLTELRDGGHTIVIAEHHTDAVAALNPTWLTVDQGTLLPGRWPNEPHASTMRELAIIGSDPATPLTEIEMSYRGSATLVPLNLKPRVGEIISLQGANGAGKSSLLIALATSAKPTERAFVPEEVADFFVRTTLRDECAYADRVARVETGLTELTLRSILGSCQSSELDELLDTHPRDLSAGTQRALAVAMQLSHKPRMILIDEPTRGLDPHARADMAEVLRCVAETGTVVLFATHDVRWAAELTSHTITLSDGQLVSPHSVEVTK